MPTSFKHAAVALDLSESSDVIVDSLHELKSFGTEKITLITIKAIPFEKEKEEVDTTVEEEKLEAYKEKLEKQEFDVDVELRSGLHFYPPTEILRAAGDVDADFLLIGNRGWSKVVELRSGSTASEVLQRAELPVLLVNLKVVKDSEIPGNRLVELEHPIEDILKHVMYATDFSDTARRAFEVVKDLEAMKAFGKLSLLHVQGQHTIALKDPASHDALTQKNREQLDALRDQLSDEALEKTEVIITFGTPVKEIITQADDHGATMIVMGSQGHGFIKDMFLGGVSSRVTRFSTIPVLLIPAER